MLSPKKVKYRKMHRGRLKGIASRNNKLNHGNFGIQALEPCWITAKQIETIRKTILHYTKRAGKLWINVFPDKSVTARAEESRMGSGKGAVKTWVAVVRPGVVLFELSGLDSFIAKEAFHIASYKLPIKTKTIQK